MDEAAITRYITEMFAGVDVIVASQEAGAPAVAWGDTFFFYDPDHKMPFATIVTKDYGDFDRASNLDRPGVFRLNIGLRRETYHALFGPPPRATGAGGVVETGHDFAALDQILPHPVYAPMYWVCVLNPSEATFQRVKTLLAEAYDMAVSKYTRRMERANSDEEA